MSEETRSYYPLLGVLIACVIVAAGALAYFHFGRIPPPYSGQVVSFYAYPIHRDLDAAGVAQRGVNGHNETFDEVLVLADVRVKNLSKAPLKLDDMWAILNLPGETLQSGASTETDFDQVFRAYPDLKTYEKPPLVRGVTIQPGQQTEGMMVFYYQINNALWSMRTGTDVSLSFTTQNPLVLHVAAKS